MTRDDWWAAANVALVVGLGAFFTWLAVKRFREEYWGEDEEPPSG